MALIGLDIGTTGCKAIVFEESGKILGQAFREYSIIVPRPDWAEQDANCVYELALQSLKEAILKAKIDTVSAMALSCQGEAVVPVDQAGQPLRNVILGMDTRTAEENIWLTERFGAHTLFERTGMPMHTINTLPKLLWLKKNQPEIWRAAFQFLLYEDFFVKKLCGRACISHCLASRTQMYDLNKGGWAEDVLEKSGIDANRLAQCSPSHGIVGELYKNIAREIGLSKSVTIVAGGHDQACAALGSGVAKSGLAMVSTGTAEVVEVATDSAQLTPELERGGISVYRHVIPNLFLAMTLNHSGGLSLRWFRDTLGQFEMEKAKNTDNDVYDLLLSDLKSGPTKLFVMPHFSGAGTPLLDTKSKAAILGMTFRTTKAEMVKALLEGLTFELNNNINLLRNSGIRIESIFAVGGGAKSRLWLQMKADICNVKIKVPAMTEAACLGAAICAGVATGVYKDYQQAISKLIEICYYFEPDTENCEKYAQRYVIYQSIYPLLKRLNREI